MCKNTYRYWSGPQEVKVCILPKQVTLRVSGVKLLSPHDEMAGKVTPCTMKRRNKNIFMLVYYVSMYMKSTYTKCKLMKSFSSKTEGAMQK